MNVSLVLGGGVALGAYHGGAYAALHEHARLRPSRIAGTSVGAVAGALILGNAPQQRVPALRKFWDDAAVDAPFHRWAILQVRTFGRPGFFDPRLPGALLRPATSLYDPAPLRERLARALDFERLNRESFSVTTTDMETGEAVVFDTRRGARITPDHLMASCGYLPEFPPVEIGGRLLGDGGLVSNTPADSALDNEDGDWTVFVVDLFGGPRNRPRTLEQAAARRLDLLFANQTRHALRELKKHPARVALISYRAPLSEGGPEKPFNFNRSALKARWAAGEADMAEAIRALG